MTAAPSPPPRAWPSELLTVADYLQLGETEYRTELVEGLVMMGPHPAPKHMKASRRLANAIESALPAGREVYQEIELNIELAQEEAPGFVRVPDLMVARAEAVRQVNDHGGIIRARDVPLVVDIISPGSVRTDRLVKRDEYADAGVAHYWIVDLAEPVSVIACHQAGEFGYADSGDTTGTFAVTEPFPFELELATLV